MTLCKASLIGFSAPFRSSAVMPFAPAARPFFNRRIGLMDCHQAPGRAWRLQELAGEVRESGRSKSQLRLVSDSFTSLFNSFKQAFRHDRNTAIVLTFTTMSLLYRVIAVFASRDSELARPGARLPSHIEMREPENSNSKHVQEANQTE